MKNLVEVKPKIFISRDDPEFLKKYLFYHPNDPEMLYQYALEWKRKKDYDKYYEYLEKAASNGSEKGKERLALRERIQSSNGIFFRNNTRRRKGFWLFFILSFLLIVLSSILISYFINHYGGTDVKERDTKHPKESIVAPKPSEPSSSKGEDGSKSLHTTRSKTSLSSKKEEEPKENSDSKKHESTQETALVKATGKNPFIFTNYHHFRIGKKFAYGGNQPVLLSNGHPFVNGSGSGSFYEKNRLIGIILTNAIVRYREANGFFPKNLAELEQNYPRNWISASPTVFYKQGTSDFSLKKEGYSIKADTLLSLHFYRNSNQLALKYGEQTLVVYPVASGVVPMPFTESRVSERVVNPNSGKGALGTRGLVLHDNYAIHGTNQPNLIGGYVSHGCIRMNNEDIENLYPYVSLHTPFFVESDVPDTPIYGDSLPDISSIGPGNGAGESGLGKTFLWKN